MTCLHKFEQQFENFLSHFSVCAMQHQKQLEQQKDTIRDAVNYVFYEFKIDKVSDSYEIRDKSSRKSCLQFEFMNHDFIQKHYLELQLH